MLTTHEVDLLNSSNSPMDLHNNDIGRKIGQYLRETGGTVQDVIDFAKTVMLSSFPASTAAGTTWNSTAGGLWETNGAAQITLPNGVLLDTVLVSEHLPTNWQSSNPVDANGIRLPTSSVNWPQLGWEANFNFVGAAPANTYTNSNPPIVDGPVDYIIGLIQDGTVSAEEFVEFIRENLVGYALGTIDQALKDVVNAVIDKAIELSLPHCFPAFTSITLADGSSKPIEAITTADLVLSHDAQGNPVAGRVTQLLDNVTDTWLVLSRADDLAPEDAPEGERWTTTVTPGHRYLRPDGSYAEIKDIVAGGSIGDGRIVDVDGAVVEVSAEVISYSAATADLYEQAEKFAYATSGGLALQPEYVEGWKTYNFTVQEHHNYVANDIRVHNDSILSFLEEGDTVYALSDDLKDMAVARDTDGDGANEIVLLDGQRFTDANGGDTFLEVEQTFIPNDPNADVEALLAQYIENNPEAASNVYDPGNGNVPGDGIPSDDIVEILTDDIGGTFSNRKFGGVDVPTLDALVLAAVTGGADGLVETLFAPMGDVTTDLAYASGDGDVSITPTGPDSTAILLFILGLDAGAEIVPGIPDPFGGGTIGGVTLGDLLGGLDLPDLGSFDINFGAGIVQSNVAQSQVGDDLVFTIYNEDETTNTMALAGVYADGNADEIASVTFADGTSVPLSDIESASANIIINGTSGDDIINSSYSDGDGESVGSGKETLEGLGGDDRLYGYGGDDTLLGGAGDDYLRGYDGADINDGGEGTDIASYYGSSEGVYVNLETGVTSGGSAVGDTFIDIEGLMGSENHDDELHGDAGDNRLYGKGGDDELYGGDGDDYLRGYEGNDIIDGGNGIDTASYWGSISGVTVNLETGAASGGYAVGDTLTSIESLLGSQMHDDHLTGDAQDNRLSSSGGDDQLFGLDGDDHLLGGSGSDTLDGGDGNDLLDGGGGTGIDYLTGGTGADIFHFDRGEGTDHVLDFEDNIDVIQFDNFSGTTTEADFISAYAAQTGNDVTFSFGDDGTLIVENVTLAQLQNDVEIV